MSDTPLILSGLNIYSETPTPCQAIALKNKKIVALNTLEKVQQQYPDAIHHTFPANFHLLPGFIDLHTHGANGADVMDATHAALNTMSEALAREGTTSYLATTMTAASDDIAHALSNVATYSKQQTVQGARILGVHLEGPFISSKKVGAQQAAFLQSPNIEKLAHWQKVANGLIKIVTLAPELPGSLACIQFLKKAGVIISLGHSDATFEESQAAISAGCGYATHLFNAMRGLHQREPGLVTAALLANDVTAELIVDGKHLHPAIVDLTLRVKGPERITLVTDAMRAKCLQNGMYDLGGQTVEVKNDCARLANGTLAGSVLTMNNALKNILTYTRCRLPDAIKMMSENPARVLGIFSETGSIALHKWADLVVLNAEFAVVLTVAQGKIVYQAF